MIRLQESLDRIQFIVAVALAFGLAALYSAAAYALEFLLGVHPAVILAIIFGLAYGCVEIFLRVRYKNESYRIVQGRDERTLAHDVLIAIPTPLAVCVRLGNYSIYSACFVVALLVVWFAIAISFSD